MYAKETLKRCTLMGCNGVCCTYGVWIDLSEKERIFDNYEVVLSCMDPDFDNFEEWFDAWVEDDPYTSSNKVVHSKVVTRKKPFLRNTCIFQRTDHKCALQVASRKIGKHPWYLKPFYCVLHPMDINDDGEITLDETDIILEENKSCLRFSQDHQLPIEIFEEELRYLLGDLVYFEHLRIAQKLLTSEPDQEIK